MEQLISSFSKYHIIETLIPGFIFITLFNLFITHIEGLDFFILTILAYFIGIVISRVSSLFTKKILFKFTKDSGIKYSEYIKATNIDKKLEELSADKNLYRNLVTVCLLLLSLKIIEITPFIKFISIDFVIILMLVLLIILFGASFIKMNRQIIERASISISKKR